jgi:hypothetical protein
MLYSFFLNLQKMLGVALPFGFATPTFIIEPVLFDLTGAFVMQRYFATRPYVAHYLQSRLPCLHSNGAQSFSIRRVN